MIAERIEHWWLLVLLIVVVFSALRWRKEITKAIKRKFKRNRTPYWLEG